MVSVLRSSVLRSSVVVALALAGSLSMGCAASAEDEAPGERTGVTSQPIINGKASTADQDAVVLLARIVNGEVAGTCTGTLVAPNLVLTARHCVADTDLSAECNSDGTPKNGGEVRGNFDPSELGVVTGPSVAGDISQDRVARVLKILDNGSNDLCNDDVAMVLLDRKIPNAKIASLRLDAGVKTGETVTSVGWGLTEVGELPSTRMQRSGVEVLDIGPKAPLGSAEFVVSESICSGDSGGPAFSSKTGAIVGVVSRGGGGQEIPGNKAASCIGGFGIYTSLAESKTLIMEGFALAGAKPLLEGQAKPATEEEPKGGLLGGSTNGGEESAPANPPPATKTVTHSGCAASPSENKSSWGLMIAMGAVVLGALARRRRAA
jgi:MYXO-CTERM domain-containing protein